MNIIGWYDLEAGTMAVQRRNLTWGGGGVYGEVRSREKTTLAAHRPAVAATRVRILASCQILCKHKVKTRNGVRDSGK